MYDICVAYFHSKHHSLQYTIAIETLQVFAPLAKLLGMYRIKVSADDVALGPF
jgi:(p)ppGpp synthase/HD superfamily hydrolase